MFQKYINTHTDRTWFALFAATTFSHLIDICISSIIIFLILPYQPTRRSLDVKSSLKFLGAQDTILYLCTHTCSIYLCMSKKESFESLEYEPETRKKAEEFHNVILKYNNSIIRTQFCSVHHHI